MYKLKCKWCMYEWNYDGSAIYNTECPKCKKNIFLNRFKEIE